MESQSSCDWLICFGAKALGNSELEKVDLKKISYMKMAVSQARLVFLLSIGGQFWYCNTKAGPSTIGLTKSKYLSVYSFLEFHFMS